MECPNCNLEMEHVDTTYSNIDTNRAYKGQHTGDIYWCYYCESHYIDNFLTGKLEGWSY
jgi:hypothetical protein